MMNYKYPDFYSFKLFALIVLLVFFPLHINADITETEIIQLKYRTANEVKEIIKPFLKKEDAIIGTGYQLIIRTNPENLQQVKEIIRKLDLPRRKLLISVKHTTDSRTKKDHVGADINASNKKTDIRIRTYSTRSRDDDQGIQRINILEGSSAYIQRGTSVPVGTRTITSGRRGPVTQDSIQYKNVGSGFYVQPVIVENRVTLYINPHQSKFSRQGGGKISFKEAETTISGKLNEWIEIGAIDQQEKTRETGITYQTRRRGDEKSRILIKVEELK